MTQTFTLASSDLTVTISPLGARLETLRFQGGPSLLLHSDDPAWRNSYAGTIVGPVANRVKGGQVRIDGKTYQMPCNENGVTALHSGPDGLDRQTWQVITHDSAALHLRCTLTDGAGGLPGNRVFDATYRVDGPCLSLDIRATTDAATPISLAHHPYWRLGDASDHRLCVAAETYLPVDARNVPTGHILPVAGTVFDHRHPRPLDPQTDHNFCIATARRSAPVRVATLHGSNGLTLRIDSTEPGLQVYAGGLMPDMPDAGIKPGAGIALEPQGWPDSPNQPGFPSIIACPDTAYWQKTSYRIAIAT
ncbi:aldose epimerase family protein [Tateyamaria pelophila]|uniref:aldose epimerase family protein n=1 Tax=Tateyamaria pelophila TaxID=328415 RepID=UPI001CC10A65|nr:aldose epimerase family protein [Tateyamaria pelophila]